MMTDRRGIFQRTISGARVVAVVCLGVAAVLLADASEGGSDLVPLVVAIALAAGVIGWFMPGNMPTRRGWSIDHASNDP